LVRWGGLVKPGREFFRGAWIRIISDGNDPDRYLFARARFFRKTGIHPRLRGDKLFLIVL
jgi:hypothetical protein